MELSLRNRPTRSPRTPAAVPVRSGPVVRLLLLVLASSLAVAASPEIVSATDDQAQKSVQTTESASPLTSTPKDVDPDLVRMNVELADDGTAAWTVEFLIRLEDTEATEAFESISDDIDEDPEPYLERFAERIETTVAASSDATDREMAIDGFAVETERQIVARDYGVIRYTFDWDEFAVVDESELRAGDAIEGFYLEDETRLLIAWPEEYELESADPEPDERRDNAAIWRGSETEFVSGEPGIVASSDSMEPSIIQLGVGAVALMAFGFGGTLWYRRQDDAMGTGSRAPRREGPTGGAVDSPTADASQELPEEFLSNEERVLRLLEKNGGRIKQQDVVSKLDWTDAKTSKVVSGLREEGKLESFRVGRENVLTLPDRTEEERKLER